MDRRKDKATTIIRYSTVLLFIHALSIGMLMAQAYTWKNVAIGGGGFVSGLIFNPSQRGLLYARTDVGGAYRWDTLNHVWIPLTDALSTNDQNFTGILSLATDPSNPARVYVASGLYTASWEGNAAIFSSTDYGSTWTMHPLSIRLGGNEDGRSAGERLQVDPNSSNILYLGSSKDGLWKSLDYGNTWNKVNSFPVATTTGAGISFILFDKTTATTGNATQTLYVGILQTGSTNLYKSTDGGATWNALPNQPTNLMPQHAVLTTGTLYITYSDGPGPNNVTTGGVYKVTIATNLFTALSLPTGQGGFAGIAVDASNANNLIVSTIDRWYPRDEIFRSSDGGATWKGIVTSAVWDHSLAPYAAANTPHWIGDVEIDPFNANSAWFITGYGVYNTTNLKNADNNLPVSFAFQDKGLEETVVTSLIAPPSGAPLLSTVGDQDGFKHDVLTTSPTAGRFSPIYGSNNSLDFAQNQPGFMARTYYTATGNYGAYSTNGGVSWTSFAAYPAGTNSAGSIALAANPPLMVWSAGGGPVAYSTNNGTSWTASSGIVSGLTPVADRVNAQKFYAYDGVNGNVYTSTNGGASFTITANGLPVVPSYNIWMANMIAVFGREGDIWLTNPNGLYHSVNSAAVFTKVTGVQSAYRVAVGKAAPGKTYPAIFITGIINNVYGFYRSDDSTATWVRINDDQQQFGSINAIAADPNTYARVYIGTGGRGIVYGDAPTALPVTLTWFTAQLSVVNNMPYADLNWQTATETNNSYFDVERSVDAISWKKIATIASKALNGNSQAALDYGYTDTLGSLSGTLYYRLNQVNKNGSTVYSTIASIRLGNNNGKEGINIWPNPMVNNTLHTRITVTEDAHITIRIMGVDGRLVYTSEAMAIHAGENNIVTDLEILHSGTYLVQVLSSTGKLIGAGKLIR